MPAEVAQMPAKVVALSDIEGNVTFLDAALAKLEISDANGAWKFGSNQLVIVGDSVDRGRDVFAVLWRLYNLSQQAHAAGGAVHVLLGNHEQYMLMGRVKSVNLEHAHGALRLGGLKSAFGADTILGEWLRQLPVLVKIGPVLFTHGGISPEVAAKNLTIAQINGAMSGYWRGTTAASPQLEAAIGLGGLTQYRGYVRGKEFNLRVPTDQDVSDVLKAYGASTMVVGHTVVPKVAGQYNGRVFAIDVNDDTSATEVLVFEDGVARVVDFGVIRHVDPQQVTTLRPIMLTDSADWRALWALVTRTHELTKVPHPY
ncbi:metallophosphoesterase [Massilia glaciei]|uniref:metallophosphoesterase n=1 Tax=Massilia glaciei TaxID=1524097 RepID=UPI0011B26F5E|nr:metallophosphoesterase [Massilia glaciei]